MGAQDQPPLGVSPDEFGSARVDEAALLDAGLGGVDWASPPPGSKPMRIRAPSGHLAACVMGDAADPWIVLVPGATGSKEDFSLMMPDLADAGYFVLSYDMAGQYQSAAAGPENRPMLWAIRSPRSLSRLPSPSGRSCSRRSRS